MSDLYFYQNWNNKLTTNIFTTIRLRNDAKYYEGKIFDRINLVSKDKKILTEYGPGQIIMLVNLLIDDIPSASAYLDTGYNKEETVKLLKTMYSHYTPPVHWETQQLSVMLIRKLKREPLQQSLF